jgi:predicted lipoprotein with Yx(FWY)xxD motif
MTGQPHRLVGTLCAALLAATVAACGADDEADDVAAEDAQPDTENGTEPTVEAADTDLGTILVDGEGATLYLFTQDSPGTSACEDECLQAWPILAGEAAAGEGVDADLLGAIERPDGDTQATYNDWPLYYFAEDARPGDLKGQGVNDVWWVVDPEGNAVEAEAEDKRSPY